MAKVPKLHILKENTKMRCDVMNPSMIYESSVFDKRPAAVAKMSGGTEYPDINGVVKFYESPYSGLIIEVEVSGLPVLIHGTPVFFAFHIHEDGDCTNDFANTGGHYNPEEQMHPAHLGDMPPLISGDGYAWMCFYDSCLSVSQILDRSVVIHGRADDFTTQPSGNAGAKIACGVIQR